MMKRLRFKSFVLVLCALNLCVFAFAAEDDGRKISILRELAARLAWPQDVFVGARKSDEDVGILGISDISFLELARARQSSSLQWAFGHKRPLEKILGEHLKSYERLGFKIIPLPGMGHEAYRAYALSYAARGSNELVLSHSEEAIEVLSGTDLFTFRDKRVTRAADAWVLFEVFHAQALKERLVWLPEKLSDERSLRPTFENLPKKIFLKNLFPQARDLPLDASRWRRTRLATRFDMGQALSSGRRYRYAKREADASAPRVKIFLHAFPTSAQADSAFRFYREHLKARGRQIRARAEADLFEVIEDKPHRMRLVFPDEIFLCDLRVNWAGVTRERRKDLLEFFCAALRHNIEEAFQISRKS